MGIINSSCQEEWCVKPAEMFCECNSKSLCTGCFSKHMSVKLDTEHKAYSLSPSVEKIIFKQLKYIRSDRSTEVYTGLYKSSEVIIKIQYFTSKSDLNRKQEEAALQRSTKHENICKCLKSFIDESYTKGYRFIMVIEKALRDLDEEIFDRAQKSRYWAEQELVEYLTMLVDALAFMQQNDLAHRDIKPGNILVFPNNKLKLADFGLSIQEEDLSNSTLKVVGTMMYLSPKLLSAYNDTQNGKNVSGLVEHNPYKSDVYSLGLTFLYMATLTEPVSLNFNIEGTTYLHHKINRIVQNLSYSQEFKMTLLTMLEVDEDARADFIQLYKLLKDNTEQCTISGISDIFEKDSANDISPLEIPTPAITFSQILEDEFLPIPIKKAIEKISSSTSFSISHKILPNEVDYIRIALHEKETKLDNIDFNQCGLGYEGMKILMQIDLSHVVSLSLGENDLGRKGARVLGKHFEELTSLKILRLWSNKIGDRGLRYLCANMPSTIEELFLADNSITEKGAKYLSKAIPPSLKILSLCDNSIGDEGVRNLCIALSKHKSISTIYLDNNSIGAIGMKYIVSYLPSTLKSLRIHGNNVSEDVLSSITCKFKIGI